MTYTASRRNNLRKGGDHAPMIAVPSKQKVSHTSPSVLIPLFIFSLALPIHFFIGDIRLSPYRVVLIIMIIPLCFFWLSGKMGRKRSTDYLVLLFSLWAGVSLVYNHGLAYSIEPFGIFFIETFGVYIYSRIYVKDYMSFIRMVMCISAMIAIILPFAIIESVLGVNIINKVFGSIFSVTGTVNMEPRFGLDRAQGPFEHPILFGVICSTGFGLSFFKFENFSSRIIRTLRSTFILMAVAFSLSVGAYVSIVSQVGLIFWNKHTIKIKKRWVVLAILFLSAYFTVDVLSNRTPFEVFISYLTFNTGNSYNRVHIWHYGIAEVIRHPLFGIGLNDWVRAYWMSSSMDNFWLLNAVRYGVPGFLLLTASMLVSWISIGRLKFTDDRIDACRRGLIITFVGVSVAACTVHLWNEAYVLFMFLLGSGMWMHDEAVRPGIKRKSSVVYASDRISENAGSFQRLGSGG